jgi:hypothetical protein
MQDRGNVASALSHSEKMPQVDAQLPKQTRRRDQPGDTKAGDKVQPEFND